MCRFDHPSDKAGDCLPDYEKSVFPVGRNIHVIEQIGETLEVIPPIGKCRDDAVRVLLDLIGRITFRKKRMARTTPVIGFTTPHPPPSPPLKAHPEAHGP